MRRVLGVLTAVAAMGFLLAGMPSAPAATTTVCDNAGSPIAPGSAVSGNITVPPGAECTLRNVRVTGSITQLDKTSLLVRNGSRITGSITSTKAWELLLWDTTVVGGNVVVRDIGTDPQYGGGTQICGTIGGNVTITGTPNDPTYPRYWVIGDDVSDVGTPTAGLPGCPEGQKVRIGGTFTYNNNHSGADVFHVRAGGVLTCTGNTTPFTGARPVWVLDNVAGQKTGPNNDGLLGDCAP